MPPLRLSPTQIHEALQTVPKWLPKAKGISRTFIFKDFTTAWAFMSRSALYAEKFDHHPNWSNVYNKVEVDLWTHDVDGLSTNDFRLAKFMDETEHLFNETLK